jgi:hypothetical protein
LTVIQGKNGELSMKAIYIIFLVIFTLSVIQSCTTLDKTVKGKNEVKTEEVDEELVKEVQELKSILGYEPRDAGTLGEEKLRQPIEFGTSLADVQELFPAPDKFEYDPMVNRKVTMLARDAAGGRFNFFFYEDKLYKVVIISKWSSFTIKFAEDDIKKTESIFIKGNGEPDLLEEDETHKRMMWLKGDLEITLDQFNLMTHQGMSRIMSLMYSDRNISPLAKKDESFELYRTKTKLLDK